MIAQSVARLGDLGAVRARNAGMEVGEMGALYMAGHVALQAADLAAVPALPHGPTPVGRVRSPRHSLGNRLVQA
jgi:hypothetical protein